MEKWEESAETDSYNQLALDTFAKNVQLEKKFFLVNDTRTTRYLCKT